MLVGCSISLGNGGLYGGVFVLRKLMCILLVFVNSVMWVVRIGVLYMFVLLLSIVRLLYVFLWDVKVCVGSVVVNCVGVFSMMVGVVGGVMLSDVMWILLVRLWLLFV